MSQDLMSFVSWMACWAFAAWAAVREERGKGFAMQALGSICFALDSTAHTLIAAGFHK